ncbi:class E sortase [Streptomyces halobius]|uniref:Class E sortase n=1 Tax=Streptomyces halobius TaxID=2879846 RepID=A0ABY4MD64_9ACTN|nr:class E sortase [Streptomyces halobius]UQA94306.1 class E sortase [Streptomyces halobius]
MTSLRPEREGRSHDPYESSHGYEPQRDRQRPGYQSAPHGAPDPYAHPEVFEAAVGQLDDPLNDPLPGRAVPTPAPERGRYEQSAGAYGRAAQPAQEAGTQGSPWFRPHLQNTPQQNTPQQNAPTRNARHRGERPGPSKPPAAPAPESYEPAPAAYDEVYGGLGQGTGYEPYTPASEPIPDPLAAPRIPVASPAAPAPPAASEPRPDEETMALRQAEEPGAAEDGDDVSRETGAESGTDTTAVSRETELPPAPGGRAARRKAAQQAAKRGGRRGRHSGAAVAASAAASAASADEEPAAPLSRVEARRAARAAKDRPSLIASRAVGEAFITLGVLMLLFVTYQLWWTNVLAHKEAGGAANTLQHEWDKGGQEKKNLTAGERFAIMYIPKLDVKVPIAEGIDKHAVLDRGMVGHYDKDSGIKTAMPWDKKGNFAVAGHRNTHGEPFRYVNKLTKGDKIIVETQRAYYTYEMASILPQTSPSNVSVIGPVPPGSGFTGPGRYITLTTCTPEFTSTYRMIVWGKMVDERPRSKGKPKALIS